MYDSYNVTTCPRNIVATFPMVSFSLEMPVHQKPLHTKQYYNTINYILQVYLIFLIFQFPVVPGYFGRKVNFRDQKINNLLGEI